MLTLLDVCRAEGTRPPNPARVSLSLFSSLSYFLKTRAQSKTSARRVRRCVVLSQGTNSKERNKGASPCKRQKREDCRAVPLRISGQHFSHCKSHFGNFGLKAQQQLVYASALKRNSSADGSNLRWDVSSALQVTYTGRAGTPAVLLACKWTASIVQRETPL